MSGNPSYGKPPGDAKKLEFGKLWKIEISRIEFLDHGLWMISFEILFIPEGLSLMAWEI